MSNLEPTHSSNADTTGSSDELNRLSTEKLRLEIRALTKPWWQTPANLGPVATVSGAILALIWAVASGFFDVSRRELDVRRRELQHELTVLAGRRKSENIQIEHLKHKLNALDQPILTQGWLERQAGATRMIVTGFNLGTAPGKAYLVVRHAFLDCVVNVGGAQQPAAPAKTRTECRTRVLAESVHGEVSAWNERTVVMTVSHSAVRLSVDRIQRSTELTLEPRDIEVTMSVERSDGKQSNSVGWRELKDWVFAQ